MFGGTVRTIELFCGIGGFAAAARGSTIRIAAACDVDADALATYHLNFAGHHVQRFDLEKVTPERLAQYESDFWWLSPPCQPYSCRGTQRDLDDPRARSLLAIIRCLESMREEILPRHLALENVSGFAASHARQLLLKALGQRGFDIRELHLCPTELGVPSRRPRYYLAASRDLLARPGLPSPPAPRPLLHYLLREPAEELLLPASVTARFSQGLRLLDPTDEAAYTTCFTAAYGKSVMASGSYLVTSGGVRRFSPKEILNLLHFPWQFRFPDSLPLRRRWKLAGNSLSVMAVRHLLSCFPWFTADTANVSATDGIPP